jgi:hypothetical protein
MNTNNRIDILNRDQLLNLIDQRHSIRRYRTDPIKPEHVEILCEVIDRCNDLGHLKMELRLNDPTPFRSWLSHYGLFSNVQNYIALIGLNAEDLDDRIGYYGELVVLQATALGLGTCWVAGTYDKRQSRVSLSPEEKLIAVIAIGYPQQTGSSRKTKPISELSRSVEPSPAWFEQGMMAVQKAPTALNQQRFLFVNDGERITASAGKGAYPEVGLGIAKLHFEIGAGALFFGYPCLNLPLKADYRGEK